MRPPVLHALVERSVVEQTITRRIRRAQLVVLLPPCRHAWFTHAFQQELTTHYQDRPQGHPPLPPARLALARDPGLSRL